MDSWWDDVRIGCLVEVVKDVWYGFDVLLEAEWRYGGGIWIGFVVA